MTDQRDRRIKDQMDFATARGYLLGHPEAFEDFPFGPDVCVYKVGVKMFATLATEAGVARMNLKCDPDEAQFLRTMFDAVLPGYHMNKRHWNTVLLDGSIPVGEIERMARTESCVGPGSPALIANTRSCRPSCSSSSTSWLMKASDRRGKPITT